MDTATTPTDVSSTGAAAAVKRKRSPSVGAISAPAAKSAKTSTQLSINYLARQTQEDLPLINKDDSLHSLLHLLSAYGNILDRHESLASNLGARPLGPILIKRFERCFESPPKVVASHSKGASTSDDTSHQITWLEVIEFARSHPGQFTLSTFSEGRRVCQFYYPQKQLRVQISEEDFLFINSGRCQELIPPLPIWEDEEKEVGTCDVLEVKLKELTNVADMVAARTRQLSHRLKGRKAAILERRAEGGSGTPAKVNASHVTTAPTSATSPQSGFVAVNSGASNGRPAQSASETHEQTLVSSAAIRNELLRHFESLPHNQSQGRSQNRHSIVASNDVHSHRQSDATGATHERAMSNASSLSPVPPNISMPDTLPYTSSASKAAPASSQPSSFGHRPSSSMGHTNYSGGHGPSKHNFSRPLPPALESSQPFRPLCQAHMDALPRGDRVLPPCDRCRRLRMDCIKNLTSCAGCTRKHARCHWRDVTRDELGALDHMMDAAYPGSAYSPNNENGYGHDDPDEESEDDDSNPLEDLEALGEKEEQENQIREDEEGLRNARELARQGFEGSAEGLPTENDSTAEHIAPQDDDLNRTSNDPSHDVINKMESDQTQEVGQGSSGELKDSPHDAPVRPSYDPVHDGEAQSGGKLQQDASEKAGEQMPANVGGFRAVNEMTRNDDSVVNGNGWRPS